nr:MAG TPA: hypothetical protein [Caudoviricetes sp.]
MVTCSTILWCRLLMVLVMLCVNYLMSIYEWIVI